MALPYNAASGLYFPVWWVLGWLGIPATLTAQSVVLAGHLFAGSTGAFFLARTMGLDRRWALFAATAFLLFGGHYSNGYLDMIMRGHSYAPWLLYALTPPMDRGAENRDRGWLRILSLPFWVWLLASGAYPGQAMAFLQVGAVYLVVHLWMARSRLREFLPYVVPAVAASLAIFAAVYLPSLVAAQAGDLYRPFPASAYWRGVFALKPIDFFGLYLNPFAWNETSSIITGWSVGVVVLIGLTGLGRMSLHRNLPLIIAGFMAFFLAFLPGWLPAGRIMESLPLLFPSRLPASDSKALIAVALVCVSALGWSRIAAGSGRKVPLAALGLGFLLIAGMALAPEEHQTPPARYPWLLVLIVSVVVLLVFLRQRLQPRILFAAVLLLTLAEGSRLITEMEVYPGVSSWALPPAEFPNLQLHDTQARMLSRQLDDPPERRPARIAEKNHQLTIDAHGHVDDALGYLGAGYHLGDYASAITMARRHITLDPKLRAIMLEPWTAWVWRCGEIDCSTDEFGVPEFAGRASDRVQTSSYGLDTIRYRVNLAEKSLVIENETFDRGWVADRSEIRPVSINDTLRGWILPAGNYEFTASYVLPERSMQLALGAIALAAWAGSLLLYLRLRTAL